MISGPGLLAQYRYDAAGQLSEVQDADGRTLRRFGYNAERLMTLHADAAGFESYYEWSAQGKDARVTRQWTNDGESYDISYTLPAPEAQGQAEGVSEGQTQATDQLGRTQHWRWNRDERITAYTNALAETWRATYNELRQRLTITDPAGASTRFQYDPLGLLASQTDPLGRTTSTGWTPLGLPWRETTADGSVTLYAYSDQGNLVRETAPDGSTTDYAYDNRGLPLRITDAIGGVKRLAWSERAQLTQYTDCSSQATCYRWDGRGHLKSVTDALGQETQTTHDAKGRLLALSTPDGAHQSYGWDTAGRLVTATDAFSRTTRFALNARGQLTARQDAEGRPIGLTYDEAQRLKTLVNENGQRFDFRYDDADRMVEETRVGGTKVQVEYDANGWPVAVTHVPGVGDEIAPTTGETTAGQTPEIPQWGDGTSAQPGPGAAQPQRTELIRDAVGRLVEKRTATHHYHYRYDDLDRLIEAVKLEVEAPEQGSESTGEPTLQKLHTTRFAYDVLGNLVEETATDEQTGQSHTLKHDHDALGNRTQTVLPTLPGQDDADRALNYLYYGSGHLHQINLSRKETSKPDAQAIHQLISDIERDALHRETFRSQGKAGSRYALDPLGRRTGAWSRSQSLVTTPFNAQDKGWQQAILAAGTSDASPLNGLMKGYAYDKTGELRQSRHSLHGDVAHRYDATGRIEESRRAPFATAAKQSAPSEQFQYDPAGNILDNASQQALAQRTQHLQVGYVKDNLVRVFEDKRYAYDGHARLIRKLSGKHTEQHFEWDEENRLTAVTTIRRPGTDQQSTQTTKFDYDALGRRIAKRDSFGSTTFIWEGMRLIEERRGSQVVSYVYEPGSYVPLARLDATGEKTDQGGLGTAEDAEAPQSSIDDQSEEASKSIAPQDRWTSAPCTKHTENPPKAAANDAEAQYWQALNAPDPRYAIGTHDAQAHSGDGKVRLCNVYYFHTDQVGMPEELSNAEGQLCWQASYKTWGATVSESWEVKELAGHKVHRLDEGDKLEGDLAEQNLRFQGQYLDRDTGLHYNTFRFYDPDIGRFISPDPVGLNGGINLESYSPNSLSWIDPWGYCASLSNRARQVHNLAGKGDPRSIRNSTVAIAEANVNGKSQLYAAGSGGRLSRAQQEMLQEMGVPRENIFKGKGATEGYSRVENHAERIIIRGLPEGANVERWGVSWGGQQRNASCATCQPHVDNAGGIFD